MNPSGWFLYTLHDDHHLIGFFRLNNPATVYRLDLDGLASTSFFPVDNCAIECFLDLNSGIICTLQDSNSLGVYISPEAY